MESPKQMDTYEDDDDTHFCIKCHVTVHGLDNYVRHRQSGCREEKPSPDVTYPEILNADAFFNSLELQSSSKTASRQPPTSLDRVKKSTRLEDRKRKTRKEKSPDDCAAKEKLSHILGADLDDPTDHLVIPSLVGFPDIVTSSNKPSTSKLLVPHSSSGKSDTLDRKRQEEMSRMRQDCQETWLEATMLHHLDNKDLTHSE